jgi:hypothetical protein
VSHGAPGRAPRILKALVAYGIAAMVLWGAVEPIRRTFLLPELFTSVARGFVILVLPVVLGAAWRYPEVGPDAAERSERE